ncbi:cobyric acid synthase, partial [Sulfolobus sp. F3]
ESGKPSEYNGLGIFDFNVYYDKRKIVSMTKAISNFGEIEGYEIRRGIIRYQDEKPIIEIVSRNNMKVSVFDGAYNNNFIGLSIHGSLFSEGGKKLLKELSDIEVYSRYGI